MSGTASGAVPSVVRNILRRGVSAQGQKLNFQQIGRPFSSWNDPRSGRGASNPKAKTPPSKPEGEKDLGRKIVPSASARVPPPPPKT